LPFATSDMQRETLLNLRDNPAGANAQMQAELQNQYESLFRQAQDEKQPRDEHRAAIAHVLFNADVTPQTDQAPAAGATPNPLTGGHYQRVLAVVGLESLIREINSQAAVLAGIESELKQQLASERNGFALTHAQLVSQAQDLAETVDRA